MDKYGSIFQHGKSEVDRVGDDKGHTPPRHGPFINRVPQLFGNGTTAKTVMALSFDRRQYRKERRAEMKVRYGPECALGRMTLGMHQTPAWARLSGVMYMFTQISILWV